MSSINDMTQTDAIIFDLDEVLVDNVSCHTEATRLVLERYVSGPFLRDDADPQYMGMRVSDMIKDLMTIHHIPQEFFGDMYRERQRLFVDLVKRHGKSMPGVREITELVLDLRLKKAVASSGSFEYITLCLLQLGLESYFDVVVSGENLHRGKPDPETFLVTAQQLALPEEHCVVLEDAAKGVIAAKAAGMRCIGVHYSGSNAMAKQDLSKADIEVNSLFEITKEMLLG
ncbi:MAG: hypothetical protein A3C10_02780 [Candidatus Magasanikbacteria bacterium RIFCSPHIGHO2_02_FULL_48_18]|nr:MAG: hypothetical protein A3I74_00445 [Candidatus Magasanikbacteria bacterium RIFCSPLOWO2_02_FULL_47_16]OGH80080.1 MAG: hypothetical protein A3C10_02780 [Candidatus Magasanikbacteria bacterium RIFCSPHIGHO2_02_FULL_48_18]